MTSLDEKEKGATAWAAGDFPLSITHFTRAIEIGGDKDFLKVQSKVVYHVPFCYVRPCLQLKSST